MLQVKANLNEDQGEKNSLGKKAEAHHFALRSSLTSSFSMDWTR